MKPRTPRNVFKPRRLLMKPKTTPHKQEFVMTRLRIGHTRITHSYLLKKEAQTFDLVCHRPLWSIFDRMLIFSSNTKAVLYNDRHACTFLERLMPLKPQTIISKKLIIVTVLSFWH